MSKQAIDTLPRAARLAMPASRAQDAVLDAEATVLGVVLTDRGAIVPVMDVLTAPDDFADPFHSRVFATMLDLVADELVINVQSVAYRMGAGSLEALQALAGRFTTKASKEIKHLCSIIAKEAEYRRIHNAAVEILQEVERSKGTDDLAGLAYLAATTFTSAAENRERRDHNVRAIGTQVDDEIRRSAEGGGVLGIRTGYTVFDAWTGGLVPGFVYVVNGPYKQRKTTWLRNLEIQACKEGASVSIFALEGNENSVYASLWAMLATDRLRKWLEWGEMTLTSRGVRSSLRTPTQQRALDEARKELDGYNLRIYDGREGIKDRNRLMYMVKRDRLTCGLDMFSVDFVQLVGYETEIFRRMETNAQMLQGLINSENVAGVLLSQMTEGAVAQTGKDSDNYSAGSKGGGDLPAAGDFVFKTAYDKADPRRLTVELTHSRHSEAGSMAYEIDPDSGRIAREL